MNSFLDRISNKPNRRRIRIYDDNGEITSTQLVDIERCQEEGVVVEGTKLDAAKLNELVGTTEQQFTDLQKRQAKKNIDVYSANDCGTSGQILKSNGDDTPCWSNLKTINGKNILGDGDLISEGGGGASATLVVGFTEDCDYCISLDDIAAADAVINAAIAALPVTGGKIILREGTYNIASNIVLTNSSIAENDESEEGEAIKANITIEGMGNSTILRRVSDFGGGVINMPHDCCVARNLHVDGNNIDIPNGYGIFSNGNNNMITETTCINTNCGINVGGKNCTVAANRCSGSTNFGIALITPNALFAYNTIKDNICTQNTVGIFANNSNNVISGNMCYENTDTGILILGSTSVITANLCYKNTTGMSVIRAGDVGGVANNITANVCAENEEVGLIVGGVYTLITCNQLYCNGTPELDNGQENVWANNQNEKVILFQM